MHLVPESKANELLDILSDFILSNRQMNDIDFWTFKRRASELPTQEEQVLIEILTYCAADRVEQAKEKALSAIRHFGHDDFVSSNIIWAMIQKGKPTVAYEAVKRMPLESSDAYDIENIVNVIWLFNDFGLDAQLNEWLMRTQQQQLIEWKQLRSEGRLMIMRDIEEKFSVSSNTINELSVLAAKVIEQHEKVVLNHTTLSILPESSQATLTLYVECPAEKIFDLNWDLSGALVDAELDEIRCVTHFEILPDSVPTFVERVSNASLF
ncbi:hypothetical protein GU271_11285 [Vibrio cholerae]|uniref:hypothetical protein n=1 Tax=Vibrio cholerae TaxID=666 RepID=UPI00155F4341|nr:hypothetical protein [Vibrio cholerae]MBJ6928180.1 hypothetical protein [Vibrio cholerae]MBJ6935458.1 hypothetical protein [Vibrio cholerae]MBJ6963181.1 hypothetical protein [Vibrio cholerae]MDH7615585.1 hypothetical protein [Vibrio cholerae]NOE57210.1 hypothetical protein [Vibrio cholerae]